MTSKGVKDMAIFADEFISLIKSCENGVYNENWIIGIEGICNRIQSIILYVVREMDHSDIIDRLINCVLDSLDLEKAMKQPMERALIMRHLKAGIRLATLSFQTDRNICEKLCKSNVQHRLLDLIMDDVHIAPAIMLSVIKALDASICFDTGLDGFLARSEEHKYSPHERLIKFVLGDKPSRVLVAAHCLMQKVVFYQSLKNVFVGAKRITSNTKAEIESTNEEQTIDLSSNAEPVLEDQDVARLCENLVRITDFYLNAYDVLSQPARCLPTTTIFAGMHKLNDPYPFVYRMFTKNDLLPSIYLLMTHPAAGSELRIITAIHQLLSALLSMASGLQYLACQKEVVQEILEFLLQKTDEATDEEGETSLMQEFGLDLSHHLQALQHVDELLNLLQHWKRTDVDNPAALNTLQAFYVFTLDQSNERRGSRAAVRVLSWKNYLASILPFIELTGDADVDNKLRKSACAGYASELLLLVLRHSESIEYLIRFQERLLAISSQEITSKIAEVKQWVEPLRKLPNFGIESIEYLCEKIKAFVLTDGVVPRIPKGLITCLRVAKFIAVEPPRNHKIEKPVELRYKYALVQLHYFDALSTLVQLIDKLADSQMLNWQQGVTLNNKHGHIFYACIVPALTLIRSILSCLVQASGTEFSDMTSIGSLLKLYTVCCTFVPSFGILPDVSAVQNEIVTALLSFTQPGMLGLQGGEKKAEASGAADDKKTLWTKMVVEILKFTSDAPYHYTTGLGVFSELLPLPLPMPTKEALSQQEGAIIQAHRRLWSSQLVPIADRIQSFIRDMAPSTQHTVQQGLRRACLQLADLSAAMANIVVKAIVDAAFENCEICETKPRLDEPGQPAAIVKREIILPATAGFARILNLLSYMTSQASFKAAFLNLLRARKEKQGDDYGRLLQYMLTILNYSSQERSHAMCQELIVSTLQSLCDEEVGMISSDQESSSKEQWASCLPDSGQLRDICCAMLKHVGDTSQTYATILPSLRVFVMLCEHDYGLECMKKALQTEQRSLHSLLERLSAEFSSHSSDCISTLSALLMLLRSLQIADDGTPMRKRKISASLARKILNWKLDSSNEDHCLVRLKQLLAEAMEEEESLYSLHDDVDNLIALLSSSASAEEKTAKDDEPLRLPTAPDIHQQFNNRQVWVICNDPSEDRLQPHYWFPMDIMDEDDDQDADRVSYALEALRAQYLPDFDLAKELSTKITAKRVDEPEVAKRKIFPTIINTSRGEVRKFIAPLRGRGIIPRGSIITRTNDPFRNRVPNTSRPPSMHVDDFIMAQRIGHPAPGQDLNKQQRDGSRGAGNQSSNDRPGVGRSNRYRAPSPADKGRGFAKTSSSTHAGASSNYRSRGSAFDRPNDRHGGGNGSSGRHTGKSSRSSSRHKSPSRHKSSK